MTMLPKKNILYNLPTFYVICHSFFNANQKGFSYGINNVNMVFRVRSYYVGSVKFG